MERGVVKTGLFVELPLGYEAQARPRSGLAAKGVTVLKHWNHRCRLQR